MKLFLCLVIVAFIAATQGETPREKLKKYSDACKSESGVDEETLTKARNGEEVNDPKLKEHGLCILKKAGFINEDGDLQVDTIKSKFNERTENHEGVNKLVTKCAVKKETPQETAVNFFKCVHEQVEKHKAAQH